MEDTISRAISFHEHRRDVPRRKQVLAVSPGRHPRPLSAIRCRAPVHRMSGSMLRAHGK